MRFLGSVVVMMVTAAVAFGTSAGLPLPSGTPSLTDAYISSGWWVDGSYATQGSGGEFAGTVTDAGVGLNNYATNFWCVDDQAYFAPVQSGYANLTLLNAIPANGASGSTTVQYDEAGIVWGNTSANGQSISDSAQVRYEMAAYLVSQYPGMGPGGNIPPVIQQGACDPGGACVADAIQQAIWAITNNNLGPLGGSEPISAIGDDTTTGFWVAAALQNYATYAATNGNDWAVVSWQVDPNTGVVSSCSPGPNSSYGCTPDTESQTFLVQIAPGTTGGGHQTPTPEPGFYGALTIGLAGLFVLAGRRRTRRA